MLNYAGTPPLAAMAETDSRQLIAAELRSLIARIEISVRLIDAAMTSEDMISEDMEPADDSAILSAISGSTEIVVLDDVTPRYATVSAALNTCRAELGHALQKLSESGNPD
jgi:pyrimidine operon attenuation protein/uracil phosphoribosyltransferase